MGRRPYGGVVAIWLDCEIVTLRRTRWAFNGAKKLIPRSRLDDRTYAAAIATQTASRQRWRTEYETAKATPATRGRQAPPRANRPRGGSCTV